MIPRYVYSWTSGYHILGLVGGIGIFGDPRCLVENFRNPRHPRHPRQFDIPPALLIASGGCICRSTNVGGAGRGTRVWLPSRVVLLQFPTTFSQVRRGASYHWFLRISWAFEILWVPKKKNSGTHKQL